MTKRKIEYDVTTKNTMFTQEEMWNLVKQILKSGFAGCISHTITTAILLWLVTWINLYSTGLRTTSTSGLLCFALKCHFDVWLYWQIGQMLLGWDEADLQTNRDLCYVGMDFEVRHALKPMTANHWELNFFIMLLRDRLGQPQLTGLLWKGEGGFGHAGDAIQERTLEEGAKTTPAVWGKRLLKMTQREPWGQQGDKGE